MKRQVKMFVLGAALSAFAGALATSAQDLRATANVPFTFHAQGPVLSSGEVKVKEVTDQGIYSITDNTGKTTFWTASGKVDANPEKPHLSFACYGHDCVLAEISMPGSTTAFKASQESIEKQLPRKIGVASMLRAPLH